MKLLIVALTALSSFAFSSLACADTSVLFSKDGSKATIMMLAFNTNVDATAFNGVLTVAAQNINGKLAKSVDFKTADGLPAIDIQCVFSMIVQGEGSCITVLHQSTHLQMSPASSQLRFNLEGADAAALAANFVMPKDGSQVFVSSDNKLVLVATRNSSGAVTSLNLNYGY